MQYFETYALLESAVCQSMVNIFRLFKLKHQISLSHSTKCNLNLLTECVQILTDDACTETNW